MFLTWPDHLVSTLFLARQNDTKPVQMMYQMKKLPYNYVPDLGLQILELPYVDDELSIFILLPEETADGSDPLLKVQNQETNATKEETRMYHSLCFLSERTVEFPWYPTSARVKCASFLSQNFKSNFRFRDSDSGFYLSPSHHLHSSQNKNKKNKTVIQMP